MRSDYLVVVVAFLLVTAGVGVAGATPLATDGASATQTDSTVNQQQATCDYASLYDETIDSVVGVGTAAGQGSGFVFETFADNDTSYVVTNAHVVGDTSSVTVQFANEESSTGEVIGTDELADLAVVRVPDTPGDAEALPLAESTPSPGTKVAAIGSPFGLDETITHGIVSGVNRSLPTGQNVAIPTVLQTDAPINPGNSGGPLLTCNGTVVGVNTAGLPASRADNIGLVVPSTLVERVVPSLVENGTYEHPYLGVSTASITPQLAAANDLDTTEGVYVHRANEGTPAAGVLEGSTDIATVDGARVPVGGDVIVAIDGREVNTTKDLGTFLFTETRPGDTVTLTVLSDGERQQVEVELGERPDPDAP